MTEFVNSATVAKNYDCILDITTKSNQISKLTLNQTTSKYEFCSTPFYCNSSGYMTSVQFTSYNNYIFSQSDFSCMVGLNSLSLYDFYLSSDFFTSRQLPSSVDTLYVYRCNGGRINGPVNPSLKSLTFYPNETFTATIYFSYLKTLDRYYQNDNTPKNTLQLKYINDLTAPLVIKKDASWIFESTNLPSLNNINITRLVSYASSNFDVSSYSNFSTYNKVNTIYIADLNRYLPLIPFPSSLVELTNNVITDITFLLKFSTPSSLISLANLKILQDFDLSRVGTLFQFNGAIPFDLNSIPSTLKTFLFEDSNLYAGLPNLMSFRNIEKISLRNNSIKGELPLKWNVNNKIKTLDLSRNQLTGTIDESYCQLGSLDISYNKLTGKLPTCFSCYFVNLLTAGMDPDASIGEMEAMDFTSGFTGNTFDNLDLYSDPPPCSTIVPNLRYDSIKGITYLFGKDLGFSDDYVYSTDLYFKLEIPSISYYANSSPPPLGYYIDLTFRLSSTIYRVSSNPLPPQIENISIVNDLVLIDGTYFSYNISIISIDIGGYKCNVLSSTFYKINCNLTILSSLPPVVLGSIRVGDLTTSLPIPTVNNSNVDTTQCQSLNYCNFNGTCLNQQCVCDSKHSGTTCLEVKCSRTCNSNEYCDLKIGECKCNSGWTGENCLFANHYASSVSQNGNLISFYGWFGTIHNDLTINIGSGSDSTTCLNITESDKIINCTLSKKPNNGYQNVYINQNSIEWIGKNLFKYQEEIQLISCFQNCSGNGKCNTLTGSCTCNQGFTGFDCSSIIISNENNSSNNNNNNNNNNVEISIGNVDNNVVSTIKNSETIFEIMVIKIIEQNINGETIKEWDLKTNNWIADIDKNNSNIFIFNQTLKETECIIVYTIEQVNATKEYSFAGFNYSIDSGSLKMSISITNYPYSSTLNNLQIQMKSQVATTSNINDSNNNNCNEKVTQIKDSINDNLLNFISIKKNGKQMYGRFLSIMLSDDRSTLMSTSIVSTQNESITLGLNLPYCNKCLIDPDFSVLLSSDFKSSCESDNSEVGRKSYVIPVAVVASVVGVALIVTVGYLIKKKKSSKDFNNKLKALNKA
ncbi:hypothetical protein ACTFIU_007201 [Dictyostelium citrinum]